MGFEIVIKELEYFKRELIGGTVEKVRYLAKKKSIAQARKAIKLLQDLDAGKVEVKEVGK